MRLARTLMCLAVVALAAAASAGSATKAEQELLAVEDAWTAALIKVDIPALEKLYATEYLFTDSSGRVNNRQQDIATTKSGEWVTRAIMLEDMKLHVYGNTGVVTGINHLAASFKGADVSGDYRFTDVFVKRDGRWQCVVTQATRVTKRP